MEKTILLKYPKALARYRSKNNFVHQNNWESQAMLQKVLTF